MNDSNKMRSLLGKSIKLEPHISPLTEGKGAVDAVTIILSYSARYLSLSLRVQDQLSLQAQDRALEDIRNGLMIASIILFFSCFERRKKRYGLKEEIYKGNSSMCEQYRSFKKVRDELIAHRGSRKANSGVVKPADPAMRRNIPAMTWGDASHVPFSITEKEIQAFKDLLEFTLKAFEKDRKAYDKAILEEIVQTPSAPSTSTHHRGKGRKNKKSK